MGCDYPRNQIVADAIMGQAIEDDAVNCCSRLLDNRQVAINDGVDSNDMGIYERPFAHRRVPRGADFSRYSFTAEGGD